MALDRVLKSGSMAMLHQLNHTSIIHMKILDAPDLFDALSEICSTPRRAGVMNERHIYWDCDVDWWRSWRSSSPFSSRHHRYAAVTHRAGFIDCRQHSAFNIQRLLMQISQNQEQPNPVSGSWLSY